MLFVSNWSWEPASVAVPMAVQDKLTGRDLRCGEDVRLGAWDVRVLVDRARGESNEEGSSP
jgi:beta-galactosidase